MEISYKNKRIKKKFEAAQLGNAQKDPFNKKIVQRLGELYAADSLNDVPRHANPHPLKGNLKRQFAVDGKHPFRILFEPCGEDYDPHDRKTIKEIQLNDIIDYH